MQTFEEIFCSRHSCSPEVFRSRLFRTSLPGYVRLLSLFLGGLNRRLFRCDHHLTFRVAECGTVDDVRRELAEYFKEPENNTWLRRVAHVRISRRKLVHIARTYLPESEK